MAELFSSRKTIFHKRAKRLSEISLLTPGNIIYILEPSCDQCVIFFL